MNNKISCLTLKKIALLPSLLLSVVFSTHASVQSPFQEGAYTTNNYRNLFQEIGKNGIDQRVMQAFNAMFYGNAEQRLYYMFNNGEYYIKTIDSNDIRSEGMSWGMIAAVQLNRKQEFDNLWRFTYNRMRNADGTFAWQVQDLGTVIHVQDDTSAPDGELYMATALFNAAFRWGNGSGILNYEEQANQLLDVIRQKLIHPNSLQIRFGPKGDAANITDPSYHLPAFYEYWADVARSHNDYWRRVAATSRQFLQTHAHPDTGLATYLSQFDGTPVLSLGGIEKPGNIYEGDAWRVAMNIGMDAHFFGGESWHADIIDNQYEFFRPNGTYRADCNNGYSQIYYQNGAQFGQCGVDNFRYGEGQVATNAVAAFASSDSNSAQVFLEKLWNDTWPTGKYRYYHGSLQMLALLHASGNFQLYKRGQVQGFGVNDTSGAFNQTIQAEDFSSAQGVQVDFSSDDNTQIVGWLDAGDGMSYPSIFVPESGEYTIELRVASGWDAGLFELRNRMQSFGYVSVPYTGGWDSYTTIRQTVYLERGGNELAIRILEGGWNFNWMKVMRG